MSTVTAIAVKTPTRESDRQIANAMRLPAVEAVRTLVHRAAQRRETWLVSDERGHRRLVEQIVLSAN